MKKSRKAANNLGYEGEIIVLEELLETEIDDALLRKIRRSVIDTDPLYAFTLAAQRVTVRVFVMPPSCCESDGMVHRSVFHFPMRKSSAIRHRFILIPL